MLTTQCDPSSVLIVCSADGFVQVYSDPRLSICIVNKPFATTPEAGIKSEDLIDSVLPRKFQHLYEPGVRNRINHKLEKVTPKQLTDTLQTLQGFAHLHDKQMKQSDIQRALLTRLGGVAYGEKVSRDKPIEKPIIAPAAIPMASREAVL